MNFQSIKIIWIIVFFIDIILSCITWTSSFFIRFEILKSSDEKDFHSYLPYMFIFILIWIVIAYRNKKNYQNVQKFSFQKEFQNILKNSILAILLLSTINYFTHELFTLSISRKFVIIFWTLNTFLLTLNHIFIFPTLLIIRNKHFPKKSMLIYPEQNNFNSSTIIKSINESTISQYNINQIFSVNKIEDIDQIISQAKQLNIKNIFITNFSEPLLSNIIKKISNSLINIHYLPYTNDSIFLKTKIELLENYPIISLIDDPIDFFQSIMKRLFDIFFSAITLTLLSPLFLVLGIIIKITSKGPIIYKQERMSLNGKLFNMYKFRTMPLHAEDTTGPVWTTANDNRITTIGKILRKSSIDELPQFFNVLRGDMSVVGPRPERPVFIQKFKENIPQYMLRHKVKGGITGWAQINGWRGNTSLENRIKADIFYIQNWSLYLDIKIIILTFFKGFFNKNAY